MKKYLLVLIIITFITKVWAQVPIGILIYGSVDYPKFIEFDESHSRSTNTQEILQVNLNLNEYTTYQLQQQVTDKLGRLHEKYQQYYKGIKIDGGEYVVHYTLGGEIYAIGGNYYPVNQFDVIPTLTEQEALNEALIIINAHEYSWNNAASEQWLKSKTNDSLATFYPQGDYYSIQLQIL